ncbi:hypothetical protein DRN32_02680 [Thermococci archaeon]|nr:MAG: hypothetical protein DRN32_02680 [Thermococci archaeon]
MKERVYIRLLMAGIVLYTISGLVVGATDICFTSENKPPSEEWSRIFGGYDSDYGFAVQQSTDGGYIIVGSTESFGSGSLDIWLIKTSSNGKIKWERTFGGSNNDEGCHVQQTNDGGYIIVGHTSSYGSGGTDIWLIKTDSDGNEIWNRTLGGNQDDYGYVVQQTEDGGYIIIGCTRSYGAGWCDVWLIKTDSNGKEEWNRTFGRLGNDCGRCVQQTSDGGYVLVGYTKLHDTEHNDIWLIKTDSNGNEEWNRTFYGGQGFAVQQTSDGGYIIVGYTNLYGAGKLDIWVIKTDSNGNEEWNRTFGGSYDEWGYAIQETEDGGYVIAGFTRSYGSGQWGNIWLVKIDRNGNEEWNKTLGKDCFDCGHSVQQTNDGGYIVVGTAVSHAIETKLDILLVKVTHENISLLKRIYNFILSVIERIHNLLSDLINGIFSTSVPILSGRFYV